MFVSRKCVDFLVFVLVILILVIPIASFISNKVEGEEEEINNNVDSNSNIQLGSLVRRFLALETASNGLVNTTNSSSLTSSSPIFHIQVTAIHIDKSEFPLSKLLFKLTLKLALDSAEKRLESRRIKLSLSIRSANTCSRQYAGAVAAEEYYLKKTRLFIVSGCDDAIRGVARLASGWQVPVMTAAGFGADLNDKTIYKSLIRVAFSLKTAVEFLVKILKSFQWKRVNLIVDESDTNSLALKDGIEKNFAHFNAKQQQQQNDSKQQEQSFILNTIPLDLKKTLTTQQFQTNFNQSAAGYLKSNISSKNNQLMNNSDDKWANNLTETSVRDALKQSSLFSRVNILLIPQHYLRKFMLSVYDQGMANGLYTFINMPLLFISNSEDQLDNSNAISSSNYSKQSFVTSTGENVFIWRSLLSTRNSQAKQAFESLMSIYLRTPTTKAYIYFANKLSNLANTNYATTTTTTTMKPSNNKQGGSYLQTSSLNKIQLSINPYSASFYDCLQIYAIVLDELYQRIKNESDKVIRKKLRSELHSNLIRSMRNKRYDNLVTGSISLNINGDREADYTLDDLNQMTGKFSPVILYKGETNEIERLSRIHWSSFDNVGPTIDNVDCSLNNTCPSKPWSRFLITILLMAAPPAIIMGSILYFVFNKIRLESQLVDYWWKISLSEIEIVSTKRKTAGNCSTVVTNDSQVSVQTSPSIKNLKGTSTEADGKTHFNKESPALNQTVKSSITKVTNTSVAYNSSVGDVCYGDIVLGIYKLAKVALKPISKFHQSRKLMIELRSIKGINHSNLCRFVGIVIEEPNLYLVTEFCPKASLREFFKNESMVIDWTFKYSIINDITAGLTYLHSSDIEFHGRLKSSNCLVSSRFVVKLSDYGLNSLYEQLDNNEDDYTTLSKQICLAPEHIMKSSGKRGSKKGDVYSFGLLLYEIITNIPPFFDVEKKDYMMPLRDLLYELKSNGISESFGPDMSIIDESDEKIKPLLKLMSKCCQFESSKRPDLIVVTTALRKITRGVTSKKLLENLTDRMEQYTNNLESLIDAKLATLVEEKLKTDELLYQFVPKSIAYLLKEGQSVEPEAFECVTVFYSDIVGFTSLSSESSPIEVIDFLSNLYLCFDEILEQYDIFKVDTIGDAYIVASGLPQRNEGKHVIEIARAAFELRARLAKFKIPHKPGRSLQMRVGIHSGPCVAGIVGGLNMPKYCVFGDTLSIGKYMESSGLPMKIHITEESKNLLDKVCEYKIEPRTPKITKDGLPFQTYWLENN